MIYKLIFDDRIEYVQARCQLHLLQSYEQEYDDFQNIKEVVEISEEEAKKIILKNSDYDPDDPDDLEEFTLYSQTYGDDFIILGGTWDL